MDVQMRLTKEQEEVVNFSGTGHNFCIFGKAGVGKTTVVKEIIKSLTVKGWKYQIVCSSGISCDAYCGLAKTVHSHYGLQTAELPAKNLLERAMKRKNVVEKIVQPQVLIWDEISMSSRRIFHFVHAIHHCLSINDFPFGGIQFILVGDFWQLKPIPNSLDAGRSVYTSELFDKVFPHRIELKRVLRQGDEEEELKNALDKIRERLCSYEVEEYLQNLERDLSPNDVEETTHVYFKRLPVEVQNLNVLASLSGVLTTFESKDIGDGQYLEKTVTQVLALKPVYHGLEIKPQLVGYELILASYPLVP